MVRDWGRWTEVKLDALGRYLVVFASAAKNKARGRTLYLDLFAGVPENVSREDGHLIAGSPIRALASRPELRKLVFFELDGAGARRLDDAMQQRFPGRQFEVVPGDCNVELPKVLARLKPDWQWSPTFAFLDQYSAELWWETLVALARFKHPRAKTKTELWLYFGDALYPRGTHGEDDPKHAEYAQKVDRLYGTQTWRKFRSERQRDEITGAEYRAELLNLMRWRLEQDLQYKTTMALHMTNPGGVPIYSMIFATDHWVGNKVMGHVLGLAEKDLVAMKLGRRVKQMRARDEAAGVDALFDPDGLIPQIAKSAVTFDPPWEPRHL